MTVVDEHPRRRLAAPSRERRGDGEVVDAPMSSPAITIDSSRSEHDRGGEIADAHLRPLQVGDERDRSPRRPPPHGRARRVVVIAVSRGRS